MDLNLYIYNTACCLASFAQEQDLSVHIHVILTRNYAFNHGSRAVEPPTQVCKCSFELWYQEMLNC